MKVGGLQVLLDELQHPVGSVESLKHASHLIFAISSLIRNVPEFEELFILSHGLPTLKQFLFSYDASTASSQRLRLAFKVVNLITDILQEQKIEASYILLENTSYGCPDENPQCNGPVSESKLSSNAGNILLSNLVKEGWCQAVFSPQDEGNDGLLPVMSFPFRKPDYIEKAVDLYKMLVDGCGKYFLRNGMLKATEEQKGVIKQFSDSGSFDGEFMDSLNDKVVSLEDSLKLCTESESSCVLPIPLQ